MKLASRKSGRDGELLLVSRDLTRAFALPGTLQTALDHWAEVEPKMTALAAALEEGQVPSTVPFEPARCASPLPRAYQWADGSAYVVHVELVRKARGAAMPPSFWTDPLMYQGDSDSFLGPNEDVPIADESWGIDFEAEIAVITDDVPMGVSVDDARSHIKLLMLANDVSLRNLIPAELLKGFGFLHGKPWTSFSPVAVTPDELGEAWNGGSIDLPLISTVNGQLFGQPNARVGMVFDFPRLIAHAAKTRPLGAGTIIGSGTVANEDRSVGSSCIVERRAIEVIDRGAAQTPFLKFGDRVRIEMLDAQGRSIFGAIDQRVVRYPITE
ncbi:MAG: fumarylacetoacetate hydrolase family protein [Longimicrobiales bacterium]